MATHTERVQRIYAAREALQNAEKTITRNNGRVHCIVPSLNLEASGPSDVEVVFNLVQQYMERLR